MSFSRPEANRILLLGNGPSCKKEYFDLFDRVYTIGMNAAYRYWEKIDWYPSFYTCLDDQVVLSHADAIQRMIEEGRFLGSFLHWNILEKVPDLAVHSKVLFLCQVMPGEASKARCQQYGLEYRPSRFFQSTDYRKLTTGSYSVRYAAALGFDRIGLIGVDCRYQEMLLESRRIEDIVLEIYETPKKNPNYFFDDYQLEGDRYNIPNPTVHGGNLHLQSFQVLATDNETFHFGLDIINCASESVLADEDVFPLRTMGEFIGAEGLGALVIPCTKGQIPDLISNFSLWSVPSHRPYTVAPTVPAIDLVVVVNQEPGDELRKALRLAFETEPGTRSAFRQLLISIANLEGDSDRYDRSFTGEVGPQGYIAGPNNLFIHALSQQLDRSGSIFLMETDVVPIRSGWLSELDRMACDRRGAWIVGSAYRGSEDIISVSHLNGNALYAVHDTGFRSFFSDFFLPTLEASVRQNPTLPYDLLLWSHFRPVFQGTGTPELRTRWRSWAHRFAYTDLLIDLSATADQTDPDRWTVSALRRDYPSTWLVHGRAARDAVTYRVRRGLAQASWPVPHQMGTAQIAAARLEPVSPALPSAGVLVVTIDTDGLDNSGHYFSYNRQLRQAFSALSADNLVLGARQARIYPDEEGWFFRTFTQRSWQIASPVDWQNRQALPLFARELQSGLLNIVTTKGLRANTVLYTYTGNLQIAANIHLLLQAWPDMRAVINLFWSSIEPFESGEARWLLEDMMRSGFLGGRLRLTVPTAEQQRLFQEAVGIRFDVAPHPSPTFSDEQAALLVGKAAVSSPDPRRVLFPAVARPEKGQALTAAIFQGLRRHPETRELDVIYRRLTTATTPAGSVKLLDLMDHLATPVVGHMSAEAFCNFLGDCDLVTLPYLPDGFSNRTSGLLIDVLYLHKPSVVSAGTWLANIVEDYGFGLAADPYNPESFVDSLRRLRGAYPDFLAGAVSGACRYLGSNSWRDLARSIQY